jgi:hypothetical protein
MKKIMFTVIALSLIAGSIGCQEKIDIEKEKEAIEAVIREERFTLITRDSSRAEATWIREPTPRKYYLSAEGIDKVIGWSEVSISDKDNIRRIEFTVDEFYNEWIRRQKGAMTVFKYFDERIEYFKKKDRLVNATIHSTAKNYISAYSKGKDLRFTDITPQFLKKLKDFLERDWRDNLDFIKVNDSNFDINVYGNTALVFHDTQWSAKYHGTPVYVDQTKILHLVKVEGKWKLDLMAIYQIPEDEDPDDED